MPKLPKQTDPIRAHTIDIVMDSLWIPIAFLWAYALSSHYNFFDNYYLWARQYEKNIDIDELLPALLAGLISSLWFAKKRMHESRLFIRKNQALLKRILQLQEDERKRIAQDLHDDLGQYLSAIKAQASSLMVDKNNNPDTKQTAQRIAASADHAYQTTHDLISALRPAALDDLGLSVALEHLLDSWRAINKKTMIPSTGSDMNQQAMHYQLHIQGNIDHYSESININVFRIVQEALTNISRHAHAQNVNVNIDGQKDLLTLVISDDGIGFDSDKCQGGFGLLGITERVESLAGHLSISRLNHANHKKNGTKISIQIKV